MQLEFIRRPHLSGLTPILYSSSVTWNKFNSPHLFRGRARDPARQEFVANAEVGARVSAVIAQVCLQ